MRSQDPGSFRDPASHVVIDGGRVLRQLDERGLEAWKALKATDFFETAVADGRIVETHQVAPLNGAAGTLEHPRLPLITYSYEWTFSMLKDAALLQLDLLRDALEAGLTIKDATPFNIQFVDGTPVFIDIGSFESYRDGEPWIGYRQFTRQFLYPLMLRAWVGVSHQPFIRGNPEGPTPAEMKQLLPRSKKMSPSAMLHVSLQARMEAQMSDRAVRQNLKDAGFSSDLILANVKKLRALVESMEWNPDEGGWVDYSSCTHVERDRTTKSEFLTEVLARVKPGTVVDLGANDAHFSDVARSSGAYAVAIDGDEGVLDRVYLRGDNAGLSIVVSDLSNPSPGLGWAGVERPALFDRLRPDLAVAYGVIHHLIYSASIPPAAVLSWLGAFGCPIVLEYVSPQDEMAIKLAGNKLDAELHPARDEVGFRKLLETRFTVVEERVLESGTRILFDLEPR